MVCQVCGTKNPEGSKFCEGCGVELKVAPAETAAAATTAAATPDASAPTPPAPAANETAPTVSGEAAAVVAAAPVVAATANETASSTAASSVPEASPVAASSEMKSTAEAPASSSPDIAAVPAVAATAAATTPVAASATPAPAAPVAAAAHSGPQLVARQFGSTTDFVFPLAGQKLSVGRFDPSTGPVDLDLSNLPGKEHVSRRHAELFFENGKWMVRDLGSTNGVYVKKSAESQFGARIQAPVALEDGDEVAFGNVQFVYQAD